MNTPLTLLKQWNSSTALTVTFGIFFLLPFAAFAQLTGTLTIGGAGSDYADMTTAITDLNAQGVGAGGVTFQIRSGTYVGTTDLTAVGTATNPIVFESVTGNATDVVIQSATAFVDAWVFDGAAFVTVQNVTIDYTGSSSASAVIIENNSDHISFSNCILNGSTSTSTSFANAVVFADEFSNVEDCDNISFDNCTFEDGGIGIFFEMSTSTANSLTVTNNTFTNQYRSGVDITYVADVMISGNTFATNTAYTSHKTVLIQDCSAPFALTANTLTGNIDEAIEFDGCAGSPTDPILVANNFVAFGTGTSPKGIWINGSDYVDVVFNSINLFSNNGFFGYAALQVSGTIADGSINVQNNILACSDGSSSSQSSLYLASGANLADLNTLDNNCYYANGSASVGYLSGSQTTLADWQAATSLAASGIAANPEFTSSTNLHINPVITIPSPLSGAGAALASVSDDIDGDLRPASPDIGADQFTSAVSEDAGVSALVAPAIPFCSGNQTVTVRLRNFGTNTLDDITINWTVNGTSQPAFNGTSLGIASGAFADIDIGTFNFLDNTAYTVVATSSDPNGVPDPVGTNDSHTESGLEASLTGAYTINSGAAASATNFTSILSAIAELDAFGVCGAVTFTVAPASGPYVGKLELTEVAGASAANAITFSGNGERIQYAPNSNSDKVIVHFNGADYITLDNFIIEKTNTGNDGLGVLLNNQADHNTLSNNTIDLRSMTSSNNHSAGIAIADAVTTNITNGAGENGSFNIITDNTILGPTSGGMEIGIALLGTNNTTLDVIGNEIRNNVVLDAFEVGIYVENTDGTILSGNDISRENKVTVTQYWGIEFINDSENAVVEKNRIHDSMTSASFTGLTEAGIRFAACIASVGNENYVQNNAIYRLGSTTTSTGILSSGSHGVYYLHNTIDLGNVGDPLSIDAIGFEQIGTQSNTRFENNIIHIDRSTQAAGDELIGIRLVVSSSISSDNNVVFFGPLAGGTQITGKYSTTDFSTMADWQTANSGAYDQNSVSIDPLFTSPATGNYLPTEASILTIGRNIQAEVADDILDNARPTSPTPGAWQDGATLPVSLLLFDGHYANAQVNLQWVTTHEDNNRGFDIERSTDGQHFAPIGWQSAHGSTSGASYTFADYNVTETSTYYYRLRQVDLDGSAVYSPVVRVELGEGDKSLETKLYPNPVSEMLNIQFNREVESAHVQLSDLTGRILFNQQLYGSRKAVLDVSQYAVGTYLVTITLDDGEQLTHKINVRH